MSVVVTKIPKDEAGYCNAKNSHEKIYALLTCQIQY